VGHQQSIANQSPQDVNFVGFPEEQWMSALPVCLSCVCMLFNIKQASRGFIHLNLRRTMYLTVTVVTNTCTHTSLSQMLFYFQVITSYCHFCAKIICPYIALSLKKHCSSIVVRENEVIHSRSPSSLPHCTFPIWKWSEKEKT